MPPSIVLLSTGQPSSNPRLVKEAVALADAGYKVSVLYCYWVNWADIQDERLFEQYPSVNWMRVGGHPLKERRRYWYTRLRSKCYRLLTGIFPGNIYVQQNAYTRCFPELKNAAVNHPAQLYIAHNLGALAPAALAAQKNKSRYGFDAEDYHRGQTVEPNEIRKAILLEDSYLPGTSYYSASSPLIADRYKSDYPGTDPVMVNNVFSLQYLQPNITAYHKGDELKLFWFSQTTGTGRGLEEMIEAMGKIKSVPVSFTIVGNCTPAMKSYFYALAENSHVKREQLHFMEPVSLADVFSLAGKHHIGLALEISTTLNWQVCLTNKIFTYLLSGLAIIATDTPAQKLFFSENTGTGKTYRQGNTTELAELLESFISKPDELNTYRQNAINLAKGSLNWEKEKELFLQTIDGVLQGL